MNRLLLVLTLFISAGICSAKSKPFPKKYIGVYEGSQEKYSLLNTAKENVVVEAASLLIALERNQATIKINNYQVQGNFKVIAKTKEYYSLEVTLNTGVIENWQLYRKDKKILRKPVHPIPATFLFKK
ncbi:MAG: hypothetical protein ACPGU5_04645 [Lishizhenia sp.]